VEITLDEQEHRLFAVIRGTVDAYRRGMLSLEEGGAAVGAAAGENGGSSSSSKTGRDAVLTVRVAGGWVRDKILGRDCHDVDVAVDRVTGVQFAQLVRRYVLEVMLPNSANSNHNHNHNNIIKASSGDGSASTSTSLLSASRRIGVVRERRVRGGLLGCRCLSPSPDSACARHIHSRGRSAHALACIFLPSFVSRSRPGPSRASTSRRPR
jgi:Poly A polymerase head domain